MTDSRNQLYNPRNSSSTDESSSTSGTNAIDKRQKGIFQRLLQKKHRKARRDNPPDHPPRPPHPKYDPLKERIHASQKHRHFNSLKFDDSGANTSYQSYHVVEKARKKDHVVFFKYNDPTSLMSELETVAWSLYHLVEPGAVPERANAHYNSRGQFVGLSVRAIPDFRSTFDEALTIEDLKNPDRIASIAIGLALSIFFEEDDLHRGNIDKNGKRIDFDMSLWPLMGKFKGGSVIDWMARPHDKYRFVVTPRDLENFPDLQDAQPFYWPTKPQPIITEGTRAVLSRLSIIKISKNAFPTDENCVFKLLNPNYNKNDERLHKLSNALSDSELKTIHETFTYYKFKTWLKCILLDDRHYLATIKKHIRNNLTDIDEHNHKKPLTDIILEHIHERKQDFKDALVQTPSFQKFMWANGQRALREIMQEFHEQNMHAIDKDIKTRNKGKNPPVERMTNDIVNLEEVKNTYSEIFELAKDSALSALPNRFSQTRL